MELIIPSSTNAGPPPPPPPFYVEKTRGSKSGVGSVLHLSCQGLMKVTQRSALHGAYLWIRVPSGQWYTGPIPWSCFDGAGNLELDVAGGLDPTDVCIQPYHDDWAQGIDLQIRYTAGVSLSAPPP
jgi:hypothetical protein